MWFRRSRRETGLNIASPPDKAGESPVDVLDSAAESQPEVAISSSADDPALHEFLIRNFLSGDADSDLAPASRQTRSGGSFAAPAFRQASSGPLDALDSPRSTPPIEPLAPFPISPLFPGEVSTPADHLASLAAPLQSVAEPEPPDRRPAESDRADSPEITSEQRPASPAGIVDGAAADQNADQQLAPPEPWKPARAVSDWMLEERLAAHKEWVESKGATGKRADLSDASLADEDLIGINLRYAGLHGADLNGADLLLADLRDASMARADLRDACLVGANLEAANLEGARLDSAMGLVPRQLAGANLRDATLPPQVREFPARAELARAMAMAWRLFQIIGGLSALSLLAIWRVKDAQLLADQSILSFLHSSVAAAGLPTAEIFLALPLLLFVLYAVLQFHLQRVWDAMLELPAIYPDGGETGYRAPRLILCLMRAHFRWMNQDAPSTRIVEKAIGILLGYWLVPAVLVLFWARYLARQDLHGTSLHLSLAAISIGLAFYASTRIGRPRERWTLERRRTRELLARIAAVHPIKVAAAAALIMVLLVAGTVGGVPHDRLRAPQIGAADARRWAPAVFWAFGYDPFPDVTEANLSRPPSNWSGSDADLRLVAGARLRGARLRYLQGYGALLANALLQGANLDGAFFSRADFRDADMARSSLRGAVLESARLAGANLDRAVLENATLDRADFANANLSRADLARASLVDAQLPGATLYAATLISANLERTNLEKADLRDARLENATLPHADVRQAYLWSANLAGANLQSADLRSAILIEADLHNADLREARLAGTVLNDAVLSGANLDDADLRGVLGLGAPQVCAAASRSDVLMDPGLQSEVEQLCGLQGQQPATDGSSSSATGEPPEQLPPKASPASNRH